MIFNSEWGGSDHRCSTLLTLRSFRLALVLSVVMALLLDVTLHNGIAPMTGKKIGLETGDPRNFKSFDELFNALEKQVAYLLKRFIQRNHIAHKTELSTWRVHLHSTFAPGCLKNGYDIMMGGQLADPAEHPVWDVIDRG